MNLVMTGEGKFIEVQGSAEGAPFDRGELDAMLEIGAAAIRRIFEVQKAALALEARRDASHRPDGQDRARRRADDSLRGAADEKVVHARVSARAEHDQR